ncbi:hypothetical protein SPRG_16330 [Saprolegnia parasitica CBS 223.65]|uniref:Methyltransferase type 11 domain-containing protein n=1 Tax=Saprolegnia parasitica (strain CBS 223.65) TaxID=695850 RepID=A0A067BUG0_SAPPC|nr:hypothetical protein SPRG_16330 [Saprolegnia parasitica CBS 223.65]KDO18227.1 hypothetical protein SPRG_16330 [Saprolegnia parasitica CBS 223.65]|eukprot:XP_012211060.1 hypothetical protein SPRG_16330 [Saprolegnia parasitica CBS 223.65]
MPNQVSTAVFWDMFYGRTASPDEWYLSFEHDAMKAMAPELTALVDGALILHLGCGCSAIAETLAAATGRRVVLANMDFSGIVLQQLQAKEAGAANTLVEFQQMDARYVSYRSATVDFIVDKGTLDSILSDSTKVDANSRLVTSELCRVLRSGGKVLSVSTFRSEHRLRCLAHPSWRVECKVIPTTPYEYPDQPECYLYVMTKL